MPDPTPPPRPEPQAPVLDYQAREDSPWDHGGTLAIACTLGFVVALFAMCSGTINSTWIAAPLLLFPIGAIVLGLRTRAMAAANSKSRGLGKLAIGLGSAQLILLLLGTLLVPQLGKAKPRAQRVKCASNLRQIGQGLMLYANDNQGRYPPVIEMLIAHANLNPEVFVCPMTEHEHAPGATTQEILQNFCAKPGYCSYIYLGAALNASHSAEHVVAYEHLSNHEKAGINVMFNDGHVEWFDEPTAKSILADLSAGRNPPPSLAAAITTPPTQPASPSP